SGGSTTVRLWRSARGRWEEAGVVRLPSIVHAVAFAPDGRKLAIGLRAVAQVLLWDLDPHHPPALLGMHPPRVTSLAFRPDGRALVTGSADRTVKVWDIDPATGEEKARRETATLRGHTGDVNWVGFSLDGRLLASAAHDGLVKLWDATTWG